jgi:hypothetical protein
MVDHSRYVNRVIVLTGGAAVVVVVAWLCLIYLSPTDTAEIRAVAYRAICIVSAIVTAGAALLLARCAPLLRSSRAWVLQLAALAQIVVAFVGITIVPFIALGVWSGYVDFSMLARQRGLLWLALPIGAVVFCLTRGVGRPENDE